MSDQAAVPEGRALLFGPFRLFASERLLFEGDKPVRLGSRALDLLVALTDRAGDLVSKRDLVNIVWPDTLVVEANLTVHIAALRRTLGDGQSAARYIVNSPGRGYRFVAPITFADAPAPADLQVKTAPNNLPVQLTRLIGRATILKEVTHRLSTQRLLTLTGAAGIGKTAVALSAAEELLPAYDHGIWFIDLAPVVSSSLVPAALASEMQLEIRSDEVLPTLITALRDKKMLLVFDNCEHVIEATADLASTILKGSRGVRILATSREPLRIEGEHVYRLSALELPDSLIGLRAAEALQFSAVQLFAERAAAAASDFELNDADAPYAARICRKLDGNPLAIELAASRVDTFGVQGLAKRIEDHLYLLDGTQRRTLPRHRTISAALDWSYQLLGPAERTIFRRLAIFANGFTLEAAAAVVLEDDGSSPDIASSIANLVMKSLVAAEASDLGARFRLLEITRAFAWVKLNESEDADLIARRHAVYYRTTIDAISRAGSEGTLAVNYPYDLDNVRAALNWVLSSGGDSSIAVALAAGCVPIWLERSLLTECRGWTSKVLDILDATDLGTHAEMVLQTAFGLSLMFTQGMNSQVGTALTRACELAEQLDAPTWQLRALVGLMVFHHRLGDFRRATVLARQCDALAQKSNDAVAISIADSINAASLFFLGEYDEALRYSSKAQRRTVAAQRTIVHWGLDHSIYAQCASGRALLHQGLFDQSQQALQKVHADAVATGNPTSLCQALTWCGCPISIVLEDLEGVKSAISELKATAEKGSLESYLASGIAYEGRLHATRGNLALAEQMLRSGLERFREAQYDNVYVPFLDYLAEVVASRGRFEEALAAADEALRRSERNDAFWWMPEAMRIKGEILLLAGAANAPAAEHLFRRSLDLGSRQRGLAWELRAAVSLGHLYAGQYRRGDAYAELDRVYRKFTEGFGTATLRHARSLLEEWAV
ncbi:winged helix-turn-helix domain-containing protein [Bradyrhizobium sp. dw_411]|uniref:ATP-binding protein n=1 Tax=Bradyrhizobium sp. dw_411 TaxID=2720082 RepID=UPI001BCDDC31